MKSLHYKSTDKLNVYSGAPVNKGFYNRNLNKAHYLYIKDNWEPPKPFIVKKPKKHTFAQKVDNYMNDYKLLKKKFNFIEKEKENQLKIIQKDPYEFEEQKIYISYKIFDDIEKFSDENYFKDTDNIVNSMKEDKNFIFQKNEISFLKSTQNIKDFNIRLFPQEGELLEEMDKNKNNSVNNINNKELFDENIAEQYERNNEEKIIDNNDEQIEENKEEENYENNIYEKSPKKEDKLTSENINNKQIINENKEYPLFNDIIKIDNNIEFYPYNYYNEEYKKNLEEIEKINNNNKINNDISKKEKEKEDEEYEKEFKNEEKREQDRDNEEDEYEKEFKNEKDVDKEENEYENEFKNDDNNEENDYENEFQNKKVKSKHESKDNIEENNNNKIIN